MRKIKMAATQREKRCHMCSSTQFPEEQHQPKGRIVRCQTCLAINKAGVRDSVKLGINAIKNRINSTNHNANSTSAAASASLAPANNSPTRLKSSYYGSNSSLSPQPLPHRSATAQGKKRAFLCAVSYRSQKQGLKGTINDVNSMKSLLIDTFGFPIDSIHISTEHETDRQKIPTRFNIQWELRWLIQDCKSGDSLVFYYSGHGSRLFNFNGEEMDGYDETLCPLDYKTQGMITDDEINHTIVKPLPNGAVLHVIIDACHSGTVLDLRYQCRLNRDGSYRWDDHKPPSGTEKGTNGGLAICFSSCDDHQVSADTDALSGNVMTGAMTYSLITILQKDSNLTYGSLLKGMRDFVDDVKILPCDSCLQGPLASLARRVFQVGAPQVPQLSSSQPFNIHMEKFTL